MEVSHVFLIRGKIFLNLILDIKKVPTLTSFFFRVSASDWLNTSWFEEFFHFLKILKNEKIDYRTETRKSHSVDNSWGIPQNFFMMNCSYNSFAQLRIMNNSISRLQPRFRTARDQESTPNLKRPRCHENQTFWVLFWLCMDTKKLGFTLPAQVRNEWVGENLIL